MAPSTPSSQPSKGEQDLSDSPHEEEKKSDENQKGVNWHETLENASDAEGEDDEEQKSPPMSVPIVSLSSGLSVHGANSRMVVCRYQSGTAVQCLKGQLD